MSEECSGAHGESFDAFYARTVPVLRFIAHVRFRVPLADAEGLVQDAYLRYVRDSASVREPERWLVATISNASRNYVRDHQREVPMPDGADGWEHPTARDDVDAISTRLAVSAVLRQLAPRCRDVLYRFHVNRESTAEIADALETTPAYVQLLLHLCRKRARALYLSLTKVPR